MVGKLGNPGKFASLCRKLKMFQWENHRTKWMAIVVSARQRQSARGLPIILYDSGLLVERVVFQPYDPASIINLSKHWHGPLLAFTIHRTGGHGHNPMQATEFLSSSHRAVPGSDVAIRRIYIPCFMFHNHHYHSAYYIFVYNPTRKKSATDYHYSSSRILLCFSCWVAMYALCRYI